MYKIYISGAITNNPNYIKDFTQAKKILESKGFEVLSPIETQSSIYNLPRKCCMFDALKLLEQADLITIITEGIKSKGMEIEMKLADYCEIPIISYELIKGGSYVCQCK